MRRYVAMRRLSLVVAGAALIVGVAGALASASFTPHLGPYKGALRNSRIEVAFYYVDHPHHHVASFETILGHTHTPYFSHVLVHNQEFSWTSAEHPNLHITGKWTGTRTISGTLRNREGVVHHWAAETAQSNGFVRRLAAESVSPRPGHWRGPLFHSLYTQVYFQYFTHRHGKARQVVAFGIYVCHCTAASSPHRHVYTEKLGKATVSADGKFSGGGIVGRFTSATEAHGTFTGSFRDRVNLGVLGTWHWKATFERGH